MAKSDLKAKLDLNKKEATKAKSKAKKVVALKKKTPEFVSVQREMPTMKCGGSKKSKKR